MGSGGDIAAEGHNAMSGFPLASGRNEERILVVDDNDAGRYAKSRILKQAGYVISEAATGHDALRQVVDDAPDLVLLDVRLPDIDGFAVCRRIKANPETAPIPILQTSAAYRDDRSKVEGLECGAEAFVTEPVEPSVLIATIRSLLRMKKAEQAVREHALEWQVTFDAISDGVALTDSRGRIIRSNCAIAAMLQRRPDEVAGAILDELLPAGSVVAGMLRNLGEGRRQRAEVASGARTYSLTVDPVLDSRAALRGAVWIVSDITERKAMNERLWHKQKLESIGLLAGGVAHDFNNILVGILGNASLGLERVGGDSRFADEAFREILEAAERAANLTRQLLAYAGRGKVVVQPVQLSDLVSEILPLVRTSIPRTVEIVLKLEDCLPLVSADRTQIEQILMNLLINAGEAIGENPGEIRITTGAVDFREQQQGYLSEGEVRGRYVMLEIADTGCGMDEETVRQMFDPFFTTKFLGRGLGLSAVLGIVRGHNGAIRVSSMPGQGSKFELLFPSSEPRDQKKVSRTSETGEKGPSLPGTILVVDDEPVVRNFFQAALQRQGYEVVLAENGREALSIYSAQPERFDLVLLDMVMPVMDGKELIARLFELRPDVRVVVTSGQMEDEVMRKLSGWDIAGFIQKPCATPALVEKVRAFQQFETPAPRR